MYELTDKLKQEFTRFYNLPFPMTQHNFDYYVELLDPYYDTKSKYEEFTKYLSQYTNPEEGYFQALNLTKNNLLKLFSSTNENGNVPLDCLMRIDTNKYVNEHMERQQVYIKTNVGKHYLSIDLKKANFQSFKFMAKQLNKATSFSIILNQCEKFEDLFKLTETDNFFINSKSLRQYIFGNLNPKKQQKIQSFIMSNVVEHLKNKFDCIDKVSGLNSDELVIQIDNKDLINDIKLSLSKDTFLNQFTFHFESFKLDQVNQKESFFIKRYDNGKIEFKNVPKGNLCEVIKFLENKPVLNEDLMFIQDGRLSKFLSPLQLKEEPEQKLVKKSRRKP